jgi:hypothetical protein
MVKSQSVTYEEVMMMTLVSNLCGVALTMVARSADVALHVLTDFAYVFANLQGNYILSN